MNTLKEVFLSVGKKTYSIKTPLEDESLERVKALIHQAFPHPGDSARVPFRGVDQEVLLVLTCLQLAYMLDSVTVKLEALLERLGLAPEPAAETGPDQ
ncbi:MAG: hypothetical protein IJ702_06335 [Fretibacterium sp.]|nr:hypothetical protein [Fretibacterium sp.]